METRVLVVNRIDKEGNISPATTFVNNESGKYNLTTLLMQLHGVNNIWDKKLRAKYEKQIYEGTSGKRVYFDFGTDVYSCCI